MRVFAKPLSAFAVLAGQLLWAGHRRDLPSLTNQDPSGTFGDPQSPNLRIAVMGDSSVTAPGVEPLDAAWPRRMAKHLADSFHVELYSVAVGGSKARDVLACQVHEAIALRPDIAIISAGANDALRATSVQRFESEYDQIIGLLARQVPCIAVSGIGDLGSIPRLPALAGSIVRIRGRSFDHAVRRVVSRYPGVLKTDTWSPGWQEFNTNPDQIFAGDLFHASAYGHRVYTAAIMPAIEKLLARLPANTESGTGQ
jgi:lysophospholipase L1-like esterase